MLRCGEHPRTGQFTSLVTLRVAETVKVSHPGHCLRQGSITCSKVLKGCFNFTRLVIFSESEVVNCDMLRDRSNSRCDQLCSCEMTGSDLGDNMAGRDILKGSLNFIVVSVRIRDVFCIDYIETINV